jgi:DNA helicase-2/ATP-dependent DNA helicase PcrA
MKFLADFHIHSKYSYATSKFIDLQALAVWGQLKGLTVMGTGDFTHPIWRKELSEQLQPAEQGLFMLRPDLQQKVDENVYASCHRLQRFMLTAEVSTIFRRNGKCYKVHSLIFIPSLHVADAIAAKLSTIGNIVYDGRPTLGLDVQDLLKIVLDISDDCVLVPAHIWTPHFGLLGANSGFDSVDEAFGDLAKYIFAVEKGLSGSYAMSAQVSMMDRFALLCNSDAHSVQNLGREANYFDTDLSYHGIVHTLKTNDLVAGIEFFPEMGKYYGSGHRSCHEYKTVEQVKENPHCSVCGKFVTKGVCYRIDQLADRTIEQAQKYLKKHYSVAPLQEIIAISLGCQPSSKKVQTIYFRLLAGLGNEFYILLHADCAAIQEESLPAIAQSIYAMRHGKIMIDPGYDGIYGKLIF